MKFKAVLTDHGVSLLERRFIPALEKVGKVCHVYLTRDYAMLLHNFLHGDGMQAVAQFKKPDHSFHQKDRHLLKRTKAQGKCCLSKYPSNERSCGDSSRGSRDMKHGKKELLFEDYRISSQNDDRIAFTIDLTLLLRALRSSMSMDGDKLQVKLVKKRAVAVDRPLPYLTFESKGHRSAVVQDVPISSPLTRADVEELQSALDMAQDLPRTLVQVPDLHRILSLADRLKNVGEILEIGITQHGDLHLQVSTTIVTIGSEYQKLRVLGIKATGGSLDGSLNSTARLEQALQRREGSTVQVSMKHFMKSLQCHLTKPDATFCGISQDDSCLTMVFQFFIPGTRQMDNSVSLYYRLPVLDPG